jgi:hypothetical protein
MNRRPYSLWKKVSVCKAGLKIAKKPTKIYLLMLVIKN